MRFCYIVCLVLYFCYVGELRCECVDGSERVFVSMTLNESVGVVSDGEVKVLNGVISSGVVKLLGEDERYCVISRESVEVLLSPEKLVECVGNCVVKIGRMLSASLVLETSVSVFRESYVFIIKLIDVSSGSVRRSLVVRRVSLGGLFDYIVGGGLFREIFYNRGVSRRREEVVSIREESSVERVVDKKLDVSSGRGVIMGEVSVGEIVKEVAPDFVECPEGMVLRVSKKFPYRSVRGRRVVGKKGVEMAVKGYAYCIDAYEYPGMGKLPKVNVNYEGARALCGEVGKRLCSDSEWRSACGGVFTYGKRFNPDVCNTEDADGEERRLARSGSFSNCHNGGVYDMSGNVAEWTDNKIVRGGYYSSIDEESACYGGGRYAPNTKRTYIGFRCCSDFKRVLNNLSSLKVASKKKSKPLVVSKQSEASRLLSFLRGGKSKPLNYKKKNYARSNLPLRLSRGEILSTLRKNSRSVQRCKVRLSLNDLGKRVRVVTRLKIENSGNVSNIELVTPEKYKGSPLAHCIKRRIANFKFPEFKESHMSIKLPFIL